VRQLAVVLAVALLLALAGCASVVDDTPGDQPESDCPEGNGPEAEVEQVLHENVHRVFRPDEPGLKQCKTGLHEHHQYPGNENPDRVQVRAGEAPQHFLRTAGTVLGYSG